MSSSDLIQPLNHLGTITVQRFHIDSEAFAKIVLFRLAEMAAQAEIRLLMRIPSVPIEETIANHKILIDESLVYGKTVKRFDVSLLNMRELMDQCGLNTDRITPTIVQKKHRLRQKFYFEITFTVT